MQRPRRVPARSAVPRRVRPGCCNGTAAHPSARHCRVTPRAMTDRVVVRKVQEHAMDTHQRRLSEKIPNNVGLTEDRRVLKALERWHPGYLDWWKDMGPEGFQESLVYLRTAVSVDPKGWAKFDYVKMPEYRWGILLAPHEEDRKIPFGTALWRAGLAGGAGRIPRHAAPPGGDPGRHRAGLGRAAAPSRQDRALALRHAQPVPGQRRGGPPSVGDGLSAAQIFRPRRPRGGRRAAAPPLRRAPTIRACSAPSTRRRRTGCRSSCSPSSPTATARCSSKAWRSPASIRCRAPAASC